MGSAHLFRNARISDINGCTQEAGQVFRAHMRTDVMPEVAAAMGWQVALDGNNRGAKAITLEGEMILEEVGFYPNGMPGLNRKLPGLQARDFKLVLGKDSKTDNPTSELRFTVVFPATKTVSKELITEYWLKVGNLDSQLRLWASDVQAQDAGSEDAAPLFDAAPAEPQIAETADEIIGKAVEKKRKKKVEEMPRPEDPVQ